MGNENPRFDAKIHVIRHQPYMPSLNRIFDSHSGRNYVTQISRVPMGSILALKYPKTERIPPIETIDRF